MNGKDTGRYLNWAQSFQRSFKHVLRRIIYIQHHVDDAVEGVTSDIKDIDKTEDNITIQTLNNLNVIF